MKTIFTMALTGLTAALCLPASAGIIPDDKPAEYPAWWFERDVIVQLNSDIPAVWPDDYPAAKHYSPVMLGQLKHIATMAFEECQAKLPPAAWSTTEGLALEAEIEGFTQNANSNVVNLGQLKHVGSLFYDLLNAQGVDVSAITGGNDYPWTDTTADDSNYGPANQGQLKKVFSFTVPVIFQEFDWAVIRYIWDGQEGGTDLDTRTAVTVPTLPSIVLLDGTVLDVGWSRNPVLPNPFDDVLGGCSENPLSLSASDTYLWHAGDNCGTGAEAVLLNYPLIQADFPTADEAEIRLRAFWYSTRTDGNLRIEIKTYNGGTMTRSGYDFVPSGGATLVQTITVNRNAQTQSSSNVDGDEMGKLKIDFNTNKVILVDP